MAKRLITLAILLQRMKHGNLPPQPEINVERNASQLTVSSALRKVSAIVRAVSFATLLATQNSCAANLGKLENILNERGSEQDWGMPLPPAPEMYKALNGYFDGKLEMILNYNGKERSEKEDISPGSSQADLKVEGRLPDGLDEKTFQAYIQQYIRQLPAPLRNRKNLNAVSFQYIKPYPNDKKYYPGLPDMLKADGLYKSKQREVLVEDEDYGKDEWKMLQSFQTFNHEVVGHAEDFNYLAGVTSRQNLEFLYCLFVLSHQQGHPVFDYPEAIKEVDFGKYSKFKEYFAELMRVAMEIDGEDLESWKQNLKKTLMDSFKADELSAVQHVNFIVSYFRLVDPDFKPWESFKARKEVLRQLALKIAPGFLKKALQDVSDEDLKRVLKEALDSQKSLDIKDKQFELDALGDVYNVHKKYRMGLAIPEKTEPGAIFFNNLRGVAVIILDIRAASHGWENAKNMPIDAIPLPGISSHFIETSASSFGGAYQMGDSDSFYLTMKNSITLLNESYKNLSPEDVKKFKPLAIKLVREILLEKPPEKSPESK